MKGLVILVLLIILWTRVDAAAPGVNSIAPASVKAGGGETITIDGSDFGATPSILRASVAGKDCRSTTLVSNTQVKCIVPRYDSSIMSSSPFDVEVTRDGEKGTGSGLLTYTVDCPGTPDCSGHGSCVDDGTLLQECSCDAHYNGTDCAVYLPVITRVVPRAGPESGGTAVTVVGDSFYDFSSLACKFGTHSNITATFLSISSVACMTPAHFKVETVSVGVALDGSSYSDATVDYQFIGAPNISSVTPAIGFARGGDTLTVHGNGFDLSSTHSAHSRVKFVVGSEEAQVSPTWVSITEVTVVAPPMAAGVASLSYTQNMYNWTTDVVQYTYWENPAVSNIEPTFGSTLGGTWLTLLGSGFHIPDSADYWHGIWCKIENHVLKANVTSSTEVRCVTPAVSAGIVPVLLSVNNMSDWTASAYRFEFVSNPTASSMDITTGPTVDSNFIYGTNVTVDGTSFIDSPFLSCKFGTAAASKAMFLSNTRVICYSTRGGVVAAGNADVKVSNNGQEWAAVGTQFKFADPCTVTAVTPSLISTLGGVNVTVDGTNFDHDSYAASTLKCRFGRISAVAAWISDTRIACYAPPNPPGVTMVEVSNNDGWNYVGNADVAVTFYDSPNILDLRPATGGENTMVNITATYIKDGANLQCVFGPRGGNRATVAATFVSSSSARCLAPALSTPVDASSTHTHPSGVVRSVVEVRLSVDSAEGGKWAFGYEDPPAVTSVQPSSGSIQGGSRVLVKGSGFVETSELVCRQDGGILSASYVSSGLVEITTAARAVGSASIDCSNNGVDFGSAVSFSFFNDPDVTQVVPNEVVVYGGRVTVKGSDFSQNSFDEGRLAFRFNGVDVIADTFTSSSEVEIDAPYLDSTGSFVVSASNDGSSFVASSTSVALTYKLTQVTAVKPFLGDRAGGDDVTLQGTNLNDASLTVKFGASQCFSVVADSASQVRCIDTPASGSAGSVAVEVSLDSSIYTSDNVQFFYHDSVSIDGFYPTSGPISGNSVVSVYGSNFVSSTYLSCRIGSWEASAVQATFVTATLIKCSSDGANNANIVAAPYRVGVANNGGPNFVNSTSDYHFVNVPIVTKVTPSFFNIYGGEIATIEGSNFNSTAYSLGNMMVAFGTSSMYVLSFTNNTYLTARTRIMSVGVLPVTISVDKGNVFENGGATVNVEGDLPLKVTAVNPSNGLESGGTEVTLKGQGMVSLTKVRFGGTLSTGITVDTSTQVRALSPAGAAGDTVAIDAYRVENVFTTEYFGFTFAGKPSMSGMPKAIMGPVNTPTDVVVHGVNFTSSTDLSCKFATIPVNVATFISSTSVLCISMPFSFAGPATAGVHAVSVANNGVDFSSESHNFLMQAAATVTSVDPAKGPVGGGGTVTVKGSNFSQHSFNMKTLKVKFGSATVDPITFTSAAEVEVLLPHHHETDVVNVEITNNDDIYSTSSPLVPFEYHGHMSVTSVHPNKGRDSGNTLVTVQGSGMTGTTTVKFGSAVSSSTTLVDSTKLLALSPAVSPGNVAVEVSYDGTHYTSYQTQFLYYSAATVMSIRPTAGPSGEDTAISVDGTNFLLVDTLFCKVGNHSASKATWISENSILCNTGAGVDPFDSGEVAKLNVSLNGVDWHFVSGSDFHFHPSFTITSMEPTRGSIRGGMALTMYSNGDFSSAGSDIKCRMGTRWSDTAGTFISASAVACITPPMTAGTYTASLSMNDGANWKDSPTSFTYRDYYINRVESGFGHGGHQGGGLVDVYGDGFVSTDAIRCKFGSVAQSNYTGTYVSASHVQCISPMNFDLLNMGYTNLTVPAFVSFDNGTEYSADLVYYQFAVRPTVTSVTPSSSFNWHPQTVTIDGSFFQPHSTSTKVSFGTVAAWNVTVESDTRLYCRTPLLANGVVGLNVSNSGFGDYSSEEISYEFLATRITYIHPNQGPSGGGTAITVYGEDIAGGLTCQVGSGTIPLTNVVGRTQATCISPSGSVGTSELDLLSSSVSTESGKEFVYYTAETITSISPNMGPLSENTTVTIVGSEFRNTPDLRCRTDSIDSSATYVSSSIVLCISNPSVTGATSIDVANNGVDFVTGSSFTVYATAVVTALEPESGPNSGGTVVTILGSNFANAQVSSKYAYARFGGIRNRITTYSSASRVLVKTPPSTALGVVDFEVSVDGHTYTAGPGFTYYQDPIVTSVSPVSAAVFSPVTLTGYFFNATTTKCYFGVTEVTPTVATESLVTCTSPALAGTVDLFVSNNGVSMSKQAHFFTFANAPTVSDWNPKNGPKDQNTLVTVTGTNFANVATLVCKFGTHPSYAASAFLAETRILCQSLGAGAPVSAEAGVPVTVSLNDVDFTPVVAGVSYEYDEPITISSFTPGSISTVGGVNVTIIGTQFSASAFANSQLGCRFGTYQSIANMYTSTSLSCLAPAMVASVQNVSASNNLYNWANNPTLNFIVYNKEFAPTSVVPSQGSLSGNALVTIDGRFFNFPSGGVERAGFPNATNNVPVTIISSSRLLCRTPLPLQSETHTLEVELSNNGVDYSEGSGVIYTYEGAPTLTYFTPAYGDTTGGDLVTVYGTGYSTSQVYLQLYTGSAILGVIAGTNLTERSAIFEMPPHAVGSETLRVSNDNITYSDPVADASKSYFSWLLPVSLTGYATGSPTSGSQAGGQVITLSGTNFQALTRCYFGGVKSDSATLVDSSTLKCLSALCNGCLQVGIQLSNNGFTFSPETPTTFFDYQEAASVTAISPSRSSWSYASGFSHIDAHASNPASNTIITVFGAKFGNVAATNYKCKFGTLDDSLMIVTGTKDTTTQIRCAAPYLNTYSAYQNKQTSLSISINGGNEFTSSLDYVFHDIDSVTSVTPSQGVITAGTPLTLYGTFAGEGSGSCHFYESTLATTSPYPSSVSTIVTSSMVTCNTPTLSAYTYTVLHASDSINFENVNNAGRSYQAYAVPNIASIEPSVHDRSATSSTMTILGTNLGPVTWCNFARTSPSAQDHIVPAVPVSTTSVKCIHESAGTPFSGGDTGDMKVSLNNYDFSLTPNTASSAAADDFAMGNTAAISSIDPALVEELYSGETMTISCLGGNYDDFSLLPNHGFYKCRFQFHKVPADTIYEETGTYISPTQVSCNIPGGYTWGVVNVRVAYDNGQSWSSPSTLSISRRPQISVVSPHFGIVPGNGALFGGTTVTITGSNFISSKPNQPPPLGYGDTTDFKAAILEVVFGTTGTGDVTWLSSTTLKAITPAVSATSIVPFNATNDENTYSQELGWYEFVAVPIVTSLVPQRGTSSGNIVVTVEGSSFMDPDYTTGGNGPFTYCKWSNTTYSLQTTVTFFSSTQIQCLNPPSLAPGLYDVAITTNNQEYSFTPGVFTYIEEAILQTIPYPRRGPIDGGTVVTVYGEPFYPFGTEAFWVQRTDNSQFNGYHEHATIISPTSIKVVSPPLGSAGPVNSKYYFSPNNVTYGSLTHAEFLYDRDMTAATSISPSSGDVGGLTEVTISWGVTTHDSDFVAAEALGDLWVKFGAYEAPAVRISTNQLRTVSPAQHNGTVQMSVSLNHQDYYSLGQTYTYNTMTITELIPSYGPEFGGSSIVVNGNYFPRTSKLFCKFGTNAAEVISAWVTSTQVGCTSVANAAGAVDLIIYNENIDQSTPFTYTYATDHTVVGVDIGIGNMGGGTRITVEGTQFQDVTTLKCRFNSTVVAAYYVDPTLVTCTSPPSGSGNVTVDISVNGFDFTSSSVEFKYNAFTVSDILPTAGPISGGSVVTILGSNLFDSSLLACEFHHASFSLSTITTASVPYENHGGTILRCETPAVGSTETVDVKLAYRRDPGVVSDNYQTVILPKQFTFFGAQTISYIVPDRGMASSRTLVNVYASGVIAGSTLYRCKFGEISSVATFVSLSHLMCRTPLQEDKVVTLSISNNGLDFSGSIEFKYTPACAPGMYCNPDWYENNLMAWWTFNEGQGNTVTDVINENTATAASVEFVRSHVYSYASQVTLASGGEMYNSNPENIPRTNFTVAAWVRPTELSSSTSSLLSGEDCFAVGFSSGKIVVKVADATLSQGTLSLEHNAALRKDIWTHIAVSYVQRSVRFNEQWGRGKYSKLSYTLETGRSSGNVTYSDDEIIRQSFANFFVNGRMIGSVTFHDANSTTIFNEGDICSARFTIGKTTGSLTTNNTFTDYAGRLDDVRMWNRPLDQAEVIDAMNMNAVVRLNDSDGDHFLVARYTFDQDPSVTTVDDKSQNSNILTMSSASVVQCSKATDQCPSGVEIFSVGPSKRSLQFSGGGTFSYSPSITLTSVTYEFWAKIDSFGGSIFSTNLDGATVPASQLNWNSKASVTLNALETNDIRWHHWALVLDHGSDSRVIYRDGVLTSGACTSACTLAGATTSLTMGSSFSGYIDEFRIWNTARTSTEVSSFMDGEVGPHNDDLVMYFRFEEPVLSSDTTCYNMVDGSSGTFTGVTRFPSTSTTITEVGRAYTHSSAVTPVYCDDDTSDPTGCLAPGTFRIDITGATHQVWNLDTNVLSSVTASTVTDKSTGVDAPTVDLGGHNVVYHIEMASSYSIEVVKVFLHHSSSSTAQVQAFVKGGPSRSSMRSSLIFNERGSTGQLVWKIQPPLEDVKFVDIYLSYVVAAEQQNFLIREVELYTGGVYDVCHPSISGGCSVNPSLPNPQTPRMMWLTPGSVGYFGVGNPANTGGLTTPASYSLGANSIQGAFTVEAWVKWTSSAQETFYTVAGGVGTVSFGVKATGHPYMVLDSGVNPAEILCASSVTANEWMHISLSASLTNAQPTYCCVQGSCIAGTVPSAWAFATNPVVTIGSTWTGELDEIRVWNELRDQATTAASMLEFYSDSGRVLPPMQLCLPGHYCPGRFNTIPIPCRAGSFQDLSGQVECKICPSGFSCPYTGLVLPMACPAGSACNGTGIINGTDVPCLPGHFCLPGTNSNTSADTTLYYTKGYEHGMFKCPGARYCAVRAVSHISNGDHLQHPLPCLAGFDCQEGSKDPRGTGACEPGNEDPDDSCPCANGYYCQGDIPKISCPPGTECKRRNYTDAQGGYSSIGISEPLPCPLGTYNPNYTQSDCTPCPRGTLCDSYSTLTPPTCPKGYMCIEEGLTSTIEAQRCLEGFYCLEGTFTNSTPPGSCDDNPGFPCPCPAGTYCLAGVDTGTVEKGTFSTPQPCPRGKYCDAGSNRIAERCPIGFYCPEGSTPEYCTKSAVQNCTEMGEGGPFPVTDLSAPYSPARPGYYSPVVGAATDIRCPVGNYSRENPFGISSCNECDAGHECLSEGLDEPKPCERGKYRGASYYPQACQGCIEGTYSPVGCEAPCPYAVWNTTSEHIYSQDDCLLCPAGLVCATSAMYDPSTQAQDCQGGYYCPAGTNSNTQLDNPCWAGYYCPIGSTPANATQYLCPPGYTCTSATPETEKESQACFPNFYCPEGTTNVYIMFSVVVKPGATLGVWPYNPIPVETDGFKYHYCSQECDWFDVHAANATYGRRCALGTISATGSDDSGDCTVDTASGVVLKTVSPIIESDPTTQSLITSYTIVQSPTATTLYDDLGYSSMEARGYNLVVNDNVPIFTIPMLSTMIVKMDLSNLPAAAYGSTYQLAMYVGSDTTLQTLPQRFTAQMTITPESYESRKFFITTQGSASDFRVQFEILHGAYVPDAQQFGNNTVVELFQSSRAEMGTNNMFFTVVAAADEVWPPLNLKPSQDKSFLIGYEKSASDSDPIVDSYAAYTDVSLKTEVAYPSGVGMISNFIPFLSSCSGFDTFLPLYMAMEDPDRCTLIPESETEIISYFDVFKVGADSVNADSCDYSFDCVYEEEASRSEAQEWWYSIKTQTVFYITSTPQDPSNFNTGLQTYVDDRLNRPMIPVLIDYGNSQGKSGYVPRHITLEINYLQVSATKKQIVKAYLRMKTIEKFEVNTNPDGTVFGNGYTLNVVVHPMTWLEALNGFAFPVWIYAIFYIFLGIASISVVWCMYLGHCLCCCVVRRDKDIFGLRPFKYFRYVMWPAFVGVFYALLPFFATGIFVYNFIKQGFFDDILADVNDVTDNTTAKTMYARAGRIGCMLLLFGGWFVITGVRALIPRPEKADNEQIVDPIMWKRSHMKWFSIMIVILCTFIIEYSYTSYYKNNPFTSLLALKWVTYFIYQAIAKRLGEVVLGLPIGCIISLTIVYITVGAESLTAFLISNFMSIVQDVVKRLYYNPLKMLYLHYKTDIWNYIGSKTGMRGKWDELKAVVAHKVFRKPIESSAADKARYETKRMKEERLIREERIKRSVATENFYITKDPGNATSEKGRTKNADVEAIILYTLSFFGIDAVVTYLQPILLVYAYFFHVDLEIAELYGVRQADMQYFFIFGFVMIIAGFIIDVLVFNIVENIYGWKVLKYYIYSAQRYKKRRTHFVLNERGMKNLMLPASVQTLDQYCFSSQFYFAMTHHTCGMVFMLFGIQCIMQSNYSVFVDPLFLPLVAICSIFHLVQCKVMIIVSKLLRIWRVPKKRQLEMDEEDEQMRLRRLVENSDERSILSNLLIMQDLPDEIRASLMELLDSDLAKNAAKSGDDPQSTAQAFVGNVGNALAAIFLDDDDQDDELDDDKYVGGFVNMEGQVVAPQDEDWPEELRF